MGDEIQAIKAGIMEIADIFVINKADRDMGAQLLSDLNNMLNMVADFPGGRRPPIIKIGNAQQPDTFMASVEELTAAVVDHRRWLLETGLLAERMRRKSMVEMNDALHDALLKPVLKDLMDSGELDVIAGRLLRKEIDPYSLAEEVARRYLK